MRTPKETDNAITALEKHVNELIGVAHTHQAKASKPAKAKAEKPAADEDDEDDDE